MLSLDSPGAAAVRLTKQTDVTATRVRWTPDGRRLVYSADGRLWRIAATGGPPAEIPFTVRLSFERPKRSLPPARFPEPGTAQSVRAFMGLALSPDGRSVAMLALGKLWVMPVGGAPRAIADAPLSAHHLAWSADGATLAWSAGPWQEQDLFATEIATGATHRITALPGREEYPSYSSDGRHLAFLYQPSEDTTILRVVDPQVRELSDTAQGSSLPAENGADVSWTPDAAGLLVVSGGFNPRALGHSSRPDRLNYNLFVDPGMSVAWGDGTAGTSTVTLPKVKKKQPPRVTTIYGRIPARQDVSVGNYSDRLTVTITW